MLDIRVCHLENQNLNNHNLLTSKTAATEEVEVSTKSRILLGSGTSILAKLVAIFFQVM